MADENEILTNIEPADANAGQEALATLESKYQAQMRQIVTQKIELPISTITSMLDPKTGQIDLSPDFQRRSIWDLDRRSRFIESIIMNIPVPPVFLGETDYARYAVLDGRQRLTAIYEFLRNNFVLRNLQVWTELNGKGYNDLVDEGLDKFFVRRFIPGVIVLKESSTQVKYDVFDRLNTGGVVAEPMEIRNAVYPGQFNALLHSLSVNADFLRLWAIPGAGAKRLENVIFNRMYDLEMVLRFFAVPVYGGGTKFKDFLSEFMDGRNKAYVADIGLEVKDREIFNRSCANAWRIFGEAAFQRALKDGGHAKYKSAPLADAVLSSLSDVAPEKLTPEACGRVREAFDKLCTERQEFIRATTSGTNGVGAIRTRLGLAREVIHKAIG